MVTEGDDLPIPSRVVRYVPSGRMRRDPDDNDKIYGPNPNAFERNKDHEYLSVTWCEYFLGSTDEQLRCAIEALRRSLNVSPKACFCVASTQKVVTAVLDFERNGRAVYYPVDDNKAHAGIHGIDPEQTTLLDYLAAEIWCQYFTRESADALPTSGCVKSNDVE